MGTRGTWRVKKSVVAVLAAAMLAVGFSSGASAGSARGGSGSGGDGNSSTPGVSADEIRVGGIVSKSILGDAAIGAQARIARQNEAGGVHGRKIVIVDVLDDRSDNTVNVNDAKQLVEQDEVFAILPAASLSFAAASYLEKNKVPFVGWGIDATWCNKEYGFGIQGNPCDSKVHEFIGNEGKAFAKLLGGKTKGKTVAFQTGNNTTGKLQASQFATTAKFHKMRQVLADTSLPNPPAVVDDYTPYAERIMTSDDGGPPDMVQLLLPPEQILGLYSKLRQLGYEGVVLNYTLYDPRAVAATDGLVTHVPFAPYESANQIPSVAQMIDDIEAYDPDAMLTQTAAAGYWATDMFIAMLEQAGPDLTRESFVKAANDDFAYDADGASAAVTWPDSHTNLPVCASFVKSDGETYHVLIPFKCYPEDIPNPTYDPKA